MVLRIFLFAWATLFTAAIAAQGYAGYVCPRCGHYEREATAIKKHTCAFHGFNCPVSSTPVPYIPTKSLEQIRKEIEKKDLREAAEDANEQGADYYDKKDWQTAINYFKIALEYDPDYEDAADNLKKAEEKLRAQQKAIEEEKKQPPQQVIKPVIIPDRIYKYMVEADNIVVPPPSWESTIHEHAEQVRLGQGGDKHLWVTTDMFLAAFDEASTLNEAQAFQFKLLVIGSKSVIASENEAEIVLFRQTAWYERALHVLKDKRQGPLLLSVIRAIKEKKPLPTSASPDLLKMAKSLTDPALGNTSVHMAMNAMLSAEARAAFFQTAKMEALSLVNDKIKGEIGEMVTKRFSALKDVNDKINILQGIADQEQEPMLQSVLRAKVTELGKKMESTIVIPGEIKDLLSLFNRSSEK